MDFISDYEGYEDALSSQLNGSMQLILKFIQLSKKKKTAVKIIQLNFNANIKISLYFPKRLKLLLIIIKIKNLNKIDDILEMSEELS